jgi:hypothetical protein
MTGKLSRSMTPRHSKLLKIALVALCCSVARAADVSVSATLPRPVISAGDMSELQVTVSGAQGADLPQQLNVEGLQIRLTGQSTQVQMVNFHVSSSAVYSYSIMPLRTGAFTIPPVTVTADGRTFQTRPLSLRVENAPVPAPVPQQAPPVQQFQPPGMPGLGAGRPRSAALRPEIDKIAFGEISCPKTTLYVGEMTPVEIRYYFDARFPVQVRGRVDFGSEGILLERFPDPKEGREERDGITYNVLTFHSLLSAVKPGSVDVPPAKLDSMIQLPGGLPPGFDDPVFRQMLGGQGGLSQPKELTVKTAPLHLQVLPLPKDGRPASFAGAVGQFDIDSIITNRRPAPGDPVNLIVKVEGKGNFKGMGAPVLTNDEGWRSYPPADKFDGSDDLNYSGVKSFDYTLIAQQPQHESPGAEFSYFDPVNAKYVTLTAKPMAVDATPGTTAAPSLPATASKSPGAPSPKPTPTPAATPDDGNPLPGLTMHSWKTPFHRAGFLIATVIMVIMTAALAVVLYLRDLEARGGSPATRRKRRIASLREQLDSETIDAAGAYEAALEYVDLTTEPSPVREEVETRITERRDLLKYGVGGSVPLTAAERKTLLDLVASLQTPATR